MPGAEAGHVLTCVDESGKGQWTVPAATGTSLPDGTDENDLVAWDDTAGEYVSRSFHQVLPGQEECDIIKWDTGANKWVLSDIIAVLVENGLVFSEVADFLEENVADVDSYPRLVSGNIKQASTALPEDSTGLKINLFQLRVSGPGSGPEQKIDSNTVNFNIASAGAGFSTWSVAVSDLPLTPKIAVGDRIRVTVQADGKITSPEAPTGGFTLARSAAPTFDDYDYPQVGQTTVTGNRNFASAVGEAELTMTVDPLGAATPVYTDITTTDPWSVGPVTAIASGQTYRFEDRNEAAFECNSTALDHTVVVTGNPAFDNTNDLHGNANGPAVCNGSSVVVSGTTAANLDDQITVDLTGGPTETDVVVASGGAWNTTLTTVNNGNNVAIVARGVTESDSATVNFVVPAATAPPPIVLTAVGTAITGTAGANEILEVVVTGAGAGTYTPTATGGGAWSVTTGAAMDNSTVISVRAQDIVSPLCPSGTTIFSLGQALNFEMGDFAVSAASIQDTDKTFTFTPFANVNGAPSLCRTRGDQGVGVQFNGNSTTRLTSTDLSVFDFTGDSFIINFFTDFQMTSGKYVLGDFTTANGWFIQTLGGNIFRFAYYDGSSTQTVDFTTPATPGVESQITFAWDETLGELRCYRDKIQVGIPQSVTGPIIHNVVLAEPRIGGGSGATSIIDAFMSRVHLTSFTSPFTTSLMDFTNSPQFKPLPKAGETTVQGTLANEADGTTSICVEVNGGPPYVTSLTNRRWSVTVAPALAVNDVVTVIAQGSSKIATRAEFTIGSLPRLVYEIDGTDFTNQTLTNSGTMGASEYEFDMSGVGSVVVNTSATSSSYLPGSTHISAQTSQNLSTVGTLVPLIDFSTATSFTISLWYRTFNPASGNYRIWTLDDQSVGNVEGTRWSIGSSGFKINFEYFGAPTSEWPQFTQNNRWYHLCGVFEMITPGSTQPAFDAVTRYQLFVNGVPAPVAYGTRQGQTIPTPGDAQMELLGGAPGGTHNYDRVKFWDRALSALEIMEEVQSYHPGTGESLHDPLAEYLLNSSAANTGTSSIPGAATLLASVVYSTTSPPAGAAFTEYVTGGTTQCITVPNSCLPRRRSWAVSFFQRSIASGGVSDVFYDDTSVIRVTHGTVDTEVFYNGVLQCTISGVGNALNWRHRVVSYDTEYETLTYWHYDFTTMIQSKDVATGVSVIERTATGVITIGEAASDAELAQVKFFQRPLTDGEVVDLRTLAASP